MAEPLPRDFRRTTAAGRRRMLNDFRPGVDPNAFGRDEEMIELADVMVESAVGYLALPVGVAAGFLINGTRVDVPLATEEPSVIAAATYAGRIVASGGGFETTAGETVTTGQIYVEHAAPGADQRIVAAEPKLRLTVAPLLAAMERRGGGWRGLRSERLPGSGVLRVDVDLDTRDAMGANLVNSVVEGLRPEVEVLSGGRVVMAILSNAASRRVSRAAFAIPVTLLSRAGLSGAEVARRIILANEIAIEDPQRAVTHNKGIMNGMTALALSTGNDTRALEAAVHSYASRGGTPSGGTSSDAGYRALTRYRSEERADGSSLLHGALEVPVPLGTVGGAIGIHPTARASLELLGNPDASALAGIAVCVGLAANFAALAALVTEGIQRGHMGLHAQRVAWAAGARGEERRLVAAAMSACGEYGIDAAKRALGEVRSTKPAQG